MRNAGVSPSVSSADSSLVRGSQERGPGAKENAAAALEQREARAQKRLEQLMAQTENWEDMSAAEQEKLTADMDRVNAEFEAIEAQRVKLGIKNAATEGGKFSIREIEDTGMYYVQADRQILFGNDQGSWGEQLTRYINREIRKGEDVALSLPDGNILLLTSTTAEKGAFQNIVYENGKPRRLTNEEYFSKLNAEAHIDELARVSKDKNPQKPNSFDELGLHGDFAKDGWRYRSAYFMDFDGKYYNLTISVAHGTNGKVIYNVAEMRRRDFPTLKGSSNSKIGARGGKISSDAYYTPQSQKSNSENEKKSERDTELQSKYRWLDPNQDISDMDGIPAVELTDGSILPISERDGRYPTHVSFIESNHISVDDLKSGGWIGNGVYSSSFTSDTARYIEREKARKRVAEAAGKPYRQFNDDFRYSERDYVPEDRELLLEAAAEGNGGELGDMLDKYARKAQAMERTRRRTGDPERHRGRSLQMGRKMAYYRRVTAGYARAATQGRLYWGWGR